MNPFKKVSSSPVVHAALVVLSVVSFAVVLVRTLPTVSSSVPVQALVDKALSEGAILVRCENSICREDGKTEILGYGQDGAYLHYPEKAKSLEELATVSASVRLASKH